MTFWDDPQHWPGDGAWPRVAGETMEGTITRMAVKMGRFGRLGLCVELDGDGRERWANTRLWRALGDLRAETGDRIKVTRGQDEAMRPGQTAAPSTWMVERLPTNPTSRQPGGWGGEPAPSVETQSGPTW